MFCFVFKLRKTCKDNLLNPHSWYGQLIYRFETIHLHHIKGELCAGKLSLGGVVWLR